MSRAFKMLKFIHDSGPVSEKSLESKFGPAYRITMSRLGNSIELEPGAVNEIGETEYLPDTWRLSKTGIDDFLEQKSARNAAAFDRWLTRGIAIAALIISLIALLQGQ